jgi:hypothetical protein
MSFSLLDSRLLRAYPWTDRMVGIFPPSRPTCGTVGAVTVSQDELRELPVEDLLARVATSRAEPGAGAVAAVCASLAAALPAMAAGQLRLLA